MLDNHGNNVKSNEYSNSFEEHFDKWYKEYTKAKEINNTTSKLSIQDTDAWICNEVDMNTKVEVFYNAYKRRFWRQAYKHKGWLDEDDMLGIILETIFKVLKGYDIKDFDKFDYFMWSEIGGACSNEARKRQAIKRGGAITFCDITKIQPIPIKEDYTLIEMNILLEQIRGELTTNEYKYLNYIINSPQIPTNKELAKHLNISEPGALFIKKSLKTKLHFLIED